MNYFPLPPTLLIVFSLLFVILVVLLQVRIVGYAYETLGVRREYMLALLLLSFLGSYANIAVAQLPPEPMVSDQLVEFMGIPYVVPVLTGLKGTVIAVNVGGAIIPALLSVYLIMRNRLYLSGALAIGIVTFAVHMMARPVPGVGIAEPAFLPPLVTAAVALLISWEHAAPLAYAAGSLGTLIGADLLNLGQIRGLGAPVASIGGAGKFDGIFLNGLVAVLLATLVTRMRRHRNAPAS